MHYNQLHTRQSLSLNSCSYGGDEAVSILAAFAPKFDVSLGPSTSSTHHFVHVPLWFGFNYLFHSCSCSCSCHLLPCLPLYSPLFHSLPTLRALLLAKLGAASLFSSPTLLSHIISSLLPTFPYSVMSLPFCIVCYKLLHSLGRT